MLCVKTHTCQNPVRSYKLGVSYNKQVTNEKLWGLQPLFHNPSRLDLDRTSDGQHHACRPRREAAALFRIQTEGATGDRPDNESQSPLGLAMHVVKERGA
jgi:hypothetical protein